MRDLRFPVFFSLLVLPLVGCDSGLKEKAPASSRVERADKESHASPGALTVAKREKLRDSLAAEGLYDCCTKPACSECAEQLGRCDCFEDIKKGDPICGECLAGYKKGEGRLKLVSIPELERIRGSRKRNR